MSPTHTLVRPQKLLILTSSGGGGLIQAAKAKEQEILAKDPTIQVIRKDVIKDWMGSALGKLISQLWNGAQITGNVARLQFVLSQQRFFDYLAWPYFFVRALITFFREEMDLVIDTQVLGTSAMLKALRIYNAKRNKHVVLQKVVVDLPTKDATHFFRPIRRLSKKDRPFLKLITIPPLLEEGQTAEDFWQTNCRLSEKDVHCGDIYVRQSFRKFQHRKEREEDFHLFLRFKNEEELELMQKSLSVGSLQGKVQGDEIHFTIKGADRLITILLGSQPSNEATFNYVKGFIDLGMVGHGVNSRCHIFVFCSEHLPHRESLLRRVADYVSGCENYPKHFTVVPFSFQSDDCIAPLFYRSDLTCTRSGGQTAMELMCVNPGETWIHSEAKKDDEERFTLEELLKGIPGWEAANALYLKKVCHSKIVTPETFHPLALQFFEANKERTEPAPDLQSMA